MKGLKKAMVSCTFDSTSLAQLRESVRARETGCMDIGGMKRRF
jgi:hypothetical protein